MTTEDAAAYGAAVEIIDDPAGGTPIPDATWAAVAREAAIERRGGQPEPHGWQAWREFRQTIGEQPFTEDGEAS